MQTEETLSGELELLIGGERFEMQLTIPAKAVNPRRMLPVFQKVANEIVSRGVQRIEAAGKTVSCRSGCGACCRQPLLISEAEAFELADLVASMPSERQEIVRQRFTAGVRHFAGIRWFERFDGFSRQAARNRTEQLKKNFVALLTEYIEQRVACPFLENESCSIYESRPLICREYLVTSKAENCYNPTPANIEKVPISGDASKAFGSLVKSSASIGASSLLLIRLLEFAESHENAAGEKPGPQWVDEFFAILTNRKEPGLPSQGGAKAIQ